MRQSHGGSAKQARAVIDGLEADVVTLGLAYDVDAVARAGLLAGRLGDAAAQSLRSRSPRRSSSWCARATRRSIHDWDDLVKPGVAVITPNPKTSGGARWNYLAAWGYAKRQGPAATTRRLATSSSRLYKNVPVLDSGARGSTTTFVERGLGDVLIAWESEALLAKNRPGGEKFDVVVPSVSIVAATPVAVVDKVVDKRGTRAVAEAYLQFLYSPEAQAIAAKEYYRPVQQAPADPPFAKLALFTIEERVRRVGQGAGGPLRRRRDVRPDLQAGQLNAARPPLSDPGLSADARVHALLLRAPGALPARAARREVGQRRVGRVLAGR